MMWLKILLLELRFKQNEHMKLYLYSDSAIKLAKNPVCHEKMKHVEVDCPLIREKIATKDMELFYVNTVY